jgi:hypothetical protein
MITFSNGGSEYGRATSGQLLWGKTSSNAAVRGLEINPDGRIFSTVSGALTPLYLRRDDVNGATYVQFAINDGPGSIASDIRKITGGVQFVNCLASAPSDYRWKDDLGPITGALDRVMRLRPKRLAWKTTGEQFEGFIAHEVEEVAPYVVTGGKDAVTEDGAIEGQSLAYGNLTTLLTAAIQELAERVEVLEDA